MTYATGTWGEQAKDRNRRRLAYFRKVSRERVVNGYSRLYNLKKKQEVFELLGNKCKKCGFGDMRALQVDHINGGGNKERKTMGGSSCRYLRVLKNPKNYQILCANCNWIKRHERGEN